MKNAPKYFVFALIGLFLFLAIQFFETPKRRQDVAQPTDPATLPWKAPDTASWSNDANADLLRYGRDLIANTAHYLGPQGLVQHSANGLNCQNCHLDAGTRPYGNNYSLVYATYPKMRARSGKVETISKRVNDCFERSLNGEALDTSSKEMLAIVSYISWLGKDVKKADKPVGSGMEEIALLDRAANPELGKNVYTEKCQSCHQANGEGVPNSDGGYAFPPLWGKNSYNTGAGLYRLSRFAGYVKNNMPQGATHDAQQLTLEEAWDVAAFVNTQPRPVKDLTADWPDISKKPVDHPFGPFADPYSESQHKFGPFKPIQEFNKSNKIASK